MLSNERWRLERADLLSAVLILVVVIFNVRGILLGIDGPFSVSMISREPWSNHATPDDINRPETPCKDPVMQPYPWAVFEHESLNAGDFPLWIPSMFSGAPFLANRLNGLVNPFMLLPIRFLSPIAALSVFYITHWILAGWFMYLFLKCMGIQRPVALAGALTYILQGAYNPWMVLNVCDKAYIPMCLYYLERVYGKSDWIGVTAFVLVFTLMATTGFPQTVVYMVYLTSAWVLFTKGPGVGRAFRSELGLILMLVVAFLLSAMQNLPTYELFKHSIRAWPEFQGQILALTEFEKKDSALTLLSIFSPRLWGDYLAPGSFGFQQQLAAIRNQAYIGVLAAIGALFAPLVWRNTRARFFTIVFLISWLFVSKGDLYVWLARFLPGLRLSQSRPDFIGLTSMIVVAAFVADHLFANLKTSTRLFQGLGRVQILVTGSVLGLGVVYLYAAFVPDFFPTAYMETLRSIIGGLSIAALAFFLFSAYGRGRLDLRWMSVGLVALVLIDLVPYYNHFNPLVPRDRVAFATPSTDFIHEKMVADGPFRIFHDRNSVLSPNTQILFGLDDMGGYDSFVSADYAGYFKSIDPKMVSDYRSIELQVNPDLLNEPFWSFLNVRYLLLTGPLANVPEGWLEVWSKDIYIYENQHWLPRWFLVGKVIPAENTEAGYALSRTINPAFEAVAEGIEPGSLQNLQETTPNAGELRVVHYSADELRLKASCEKDRYLVFSDTFYPGWRAWVDGNEVKIYRTDAVAKGIIVPAGEHEVRFLYDPPMYKLGWILAFAGLLIFPVVVIVSRRLMN